MVSSAGGGRNVLEFQFQEQKSLQKQKSIAIDTVELPLSDCDTNLVQNAKLLFSTSAAASAVNRSQTSTSSGITEQIKTVREHKYKF